MTAEAASMEIALRGEVKRLREENSALQKEAVRARQLQNEVDFLRNTTLLQHEEKVPIRLRELEKENVSLRRRVNSLEERLRTMEQDSNRITHLDAHHSYSLSPSLKQETGQPGVDGDGGQENNTTNLSSISAKARSVVALRGGHPCGNCARRVSVVEQAANQEKAAMRGQIEELEKKLKKAEGELGEIAKWVSTVVASNAQFPLSMQQGTLRTHGASPHQTNNFHSPQRHALQNPKGQPQSILPNTREQFPNSPQWSSEQGPVGRSYTESHRQLSQVSRQNPYM